MGKCATINYTLQYFAVDSSPCIAFFRIWEIFMNPFSKARWIWYSEKNEADDYGEFYTPLDYTSGQAELFILADSNYAVYVNGALCALGQYADYPYDKVYDRIDITKYLKQGENHIAVLVWYYGIDTTQVYYPGKAGVCFEVKIDGKAQAYSSKNTLSRKSRAYTCHMEKIITAQLGLSYHYDATKEDFWTHGTLDGFSESQEVSIDSPMRERPIKRLEFDKFREAKFIKTLENGNLLYDLGTNCVGLLELEIEASQKTHLTIAYGEHIVDGCVRRFIGARDFSVEITVDKGITRYTNPFRRLGAKYLEIAADSSVIIKKIGLRETTYPLNSLKRPPLTEKEQSIYDICERTLRLCMHEHYEDCPWREQALYCMDSRNQMLCGYYAFGEYDFPKACLKLIAEDDRADGLLSICYPTAKDLVIPSFSLHFFTECAEYLEYSRDKEFIREIYPKLLSALDVFLEKGAKDGNIISSFDGECYWNFYEWSRGLNDRDLTAEAIPDLILNSLLSIALQKTAYIATELGYEDVYSPLSDKLNAAIRKVFYDNEKGLFKNFEYACDNYSVLGNSLAILSGAATDKDAKIIAEKLCNDKSLTPISLSMRCFLNDALLKVDREKYSSFILDEIERIYRPMVDMGVGTVWETELGEIDFSRAGSLCHGWSALPLYYYHILKN